MANARLTALEALRRVNEDDGYSNLVLDQALKQAGLDERDRSLASILFYGVLEHRITLDWVISKYSSKPISKVSPKVRDILRMGIYQLAYLDKVPPSAAVNESVKLTRVCGQERASGFVNGVLRSFARSHCDLQLPNERELPFAYRSIRYSCPEWLIRMWNKAYGEENTLGLLASLEGRPPLAARINTCKGNDRDLLEKWSKEGIKVREVEGIPHAVCLEQTGSIEQLSAFQRGEFHVQDLASQIACWVLGPQPGERVIDVCPAPGGKAFTMAQMMENRGQLLSFDLYPAKVRLIEEGAKRLGLPIIQAAVRDARNDPEFVPKANRVLCDAPCSGLGIIRRKPEIRYKNSNTLDSLPDLQYLILCKSSELVEKGGILLYSTCTLNPKENGKVADKFLKGYPEFVPYPIKLPKWVIRHDWEPSHQLTLLPHLHGTDGFFLSAFQRLR